MRAAALAVWVAAALASGCRATIPDGRFACDLDSDCPPGQRCHSGVCTTEDRCAADPDGAQCRDGSTPQRDGGGEDDAGFARDAGPDSGPVDGGPCPEACGGDTPFCDESAGACVGCLTSNDCDAPSAARCDPDTQRCVPCASHPECAGIGGLPACDEGRCVECTPETEAERCGAFACDPLRRECTTRERGSSGTCEPCSADSECIAGHKCIPMAYGDDPVYGSYCLREAASGCAAPWTVILADRQSTSGAFAANYCGIAEELTTCDAVLAALREEPCSPGDGACPDGGECATDRCTYACSTSAQCPTGQPCGSVSRVCGG